MIGVALVTKSSTPQAWIAHLTGLWREIDESVLVGVAYNDDPAKYGDQLAELMDSFDPRRYVVVGQDDVVPLAWPRYPGDRGWQPQLPPEGTIAAMNLIDLEGRRWFDWAYYEHDPANGRWGSHLQALDANPPHPHTYITGGAQIWSPEARKVASYRGKPFGSGDDMQVCWEAVLAGIRLMPPNLSLPTAIHLDRRYPGVGL